MKPQHKLAAGLLWLAMLLTLLLFSAWWVRSNQQEFHLLNSDLVHPFLLMSDLLHNPAEIFSWYHSPAPYVFPDWLLAGMVVATGMPGSWQPLAYGALLLTLYAAAAGYLIHTGTGLGVSAGGTLFAAHFMLLGSAIAATGAPDISASMYAYLMAPFIHTGALLLSLLAMGGLLAILHGGQRNRVLSWLLPVIALATFSDFIFVVWFVLPALIVTLIQALLARRRQNLVTAAAILGAALIGYGVERAVHSARRAHTSSTATGMGESLDWLSRHAALAERTADIPSAMLVLAIVAMMGRAAWVLFILIRGAPNKPRYTAELLLTAMSAGALSAPIVTGMISAIGSLRYFLPIFVIPLLLSSFYLAESLRKRESTRILYGASALLLALLFLVAPGGWNAAIALTAPRQLQNCLEASGRTAGFSDYWNAKLTMLLSDRKIHVVAISSKGAPFRWNTNESWYTHRADNAEPVTYDFILTRNLDTAALLQAYGPPAETQTCGNETIWLYDRPLSLK